MAYANNAEPARDAQPACGAATVSLKGGTLCRGTGRPLSLGLLLGVLLFMTSGAMAQSFPPPLRDLSQRFAWSGYVQLRYTAQESSDDLFGLRRFKLMVGGHLARNVYWYAQGLFKDGNGSPTDGRVYFQEAWLRFAFRKEVQLVVGQFKPPFGRERFTPDFLIFTIDRSLVTDALTPDGPYVDSFYRDRGVQVDGELPKRFRYAAAVFDGRGANHQFHGIGPMIVGQMLNDAVKNRQIRGRPLSVRVGAASAFRWGRDLPFRPCCSRVPWNGLAHFHGADRRWNVEFSADWGKSSLRAEYMRAQYRSAADAALSFTASGWYVQIAQFLAPKWQVVAKFERLDPNERLDNSRDVHQATLGVNYYLRENRVKVMAGYVFRQETSQPTANNLIQVQLQYFLNQGRGGN